MVELDRLLLKVRLCEIKDRWWNIGIVQLEWHDPRSDRLYRIRVKRGKGRDVVHIWGCNRIAGGQRVLIRVDVCGNRHPQRTRVVSLVGDLKRKRERTDSREDVVENGRTSFQTWVLAGAYP